MPDLVVSDIGTVSSSSSSDSTSCQDLIEATKRHLYTGGREERNKLAADLNSSDVTLSVTYGLGGIQAGSKISVDLEDMHVWAAAATNTVTVKRADFGSSAASHTTGAVVTVNPKFSDFDIFRALNETLRDLSSPQSGLFQVKTTNLTYQAAIQGYDLTSVGSDFIGIHQVRWKVTDPSLRWPRIKHFSVLRNMPTTDFASSLALVVYESAVPGRTVNVSYKASFGLFSTAADNVLATTGLPSTAHDILPIGAAIRLTLGREIKRNFTEAQSDTRRAAEVPAGANLNAMRQLQAQYAERVAAESARLLAEYPVERGFV